MKLKNKLISLGLLASLCLPSASLISCAASEENSYDTVQIAVTAASSMNFIRYKVSANLAAPTVFPLMESMPGGAIKDKLNLQPVIMTDTNGAGIVGSSLTHGAMLPDQNGKTYQLGLSRREINIQIRPNLSWSNGDKLFASNYVDTIKAMLDLNNASEWVSTVERLGITNATKSYEAQEAYMARHGQPYDDPFNYKGLPIGNGKDNFPEELEACLNLGAKVDGDSKLILAFDHEESLNFFDNIVSPVFWPINRKFIMEHGGFDEFGKTTDQMVSSGAYTPEYFDAKYGVEYGINQKYYNYQNVITPHLNFRFISNPSTVSTLFKDGKILATKVSKDFIEDFISDPKIKWRLSRQTGIGTLALFLNQSSNNQKDILKDNNFRKALFYGIDRQQLLSALNLDFSNPVGIYTAASSQTANGTTYISTFENSAYTVHTPENHDVNLPFMISPTESRGYSQQNDFFLRKDLLFDKKIAQEFLSQAKKDHPNDFPVKLNFPYESTDEIGKNLEVVLKDYMKRSFGDDIQIESHALPPIVFAERHSQGQWDIIIKQVDPETRQPWDYLGEFVKPDEPDPKNGKTVGFLKNNAGGATYTDYFKKLTPAQEERLKKDFNISDFQFDVAKYLTTYQDLDDTTGEFDNNILRNKILVDIIPEKEDNNHHLTLAKYKGVELSSHESKLSKYINTFSAIEVAPKIIDWNRAVQSNDEKAKRNALDALIRAKESFAQSTIPQMIAYDTIYQTIEKIQRDMLPTIPIAEADNVWKATRAMGGSTSPRGFWVNPEYLYDGDHKPNSWLESEKTEGTT